MKLVIKQTVKKISQASSFLTSNKLDYLLIFALVFILFSYYQAAPAFPDPDSFYHAKISKLIAEQGIIRDFIWQPFTTLADSFSDQHLLYHLLLIPLVKFLPSLMGLKLFTAFTASCFIVCFYFLLKKLNCLYPGFFTLLLVITTPFTFRLNLAKATALVLIAVFLGIYFLLQKKLWSLGLLAFFYVWLHGGFLVIIAFAGLYSLLTWIWSLKVTAIKQTWKNWQPFLATCLGVAAGLVIHPSWPKNLIFFWQQTVQIGLVNYHKIIGVGSEWYPYELDQLVSGTWIVSIILIVSLTLYFITIKKQSIKSLFFLIITAVFLFFTLRSQRYVEYYIPLALLAIAYILSLVVKTYNLKTQSQKIFHLLPLAGKIIALIVLVYSLITFGFITFSDLKTSSQQLRQGIPLTKYQRASLWIQNQVPPGEIILHSDWDDFPLLFYHNSQNRYITGLDPTFFYLQDPELHKLWVDITIGNYVADLVPTIKERFALSWVIIEKDHIEMRNNFQAEKMASLVYQDDEVWIYHLNTNF